MSIFQDRSAVSYVQCLLCLFVKDISIGQDRIKAGQRFLLKKFQRRLLDFTSMIFRNRDVLFCSGREKSGSPSLRTDSLPVSRQRAVCHDCVELEVALAGQELARVRAGDRHNQLVHIGEQIARARGLVITTRPL